MSRPSGHTPLPHKYYTCHDLLYVHPFLTSTTSSTACCTYTPSSQMPPIWNNTKRPPKHLHNQESKGTHEAPNHRYSLTSATDTNVIPGRDLENTTRHPDVPRQTNEHIPRQITSTHRYSYWCTHPNRRKRENTDTVCTKNNTSSHRTQNPDTAWTKNNTS